MAGLTHISDFLGLRKSTVGLLCMVILVGMGERMAERFLPIYLIALGGGALSIGLLNGLDNLLSALYSFPGGYLSDRIGTGKESVEAFTLHESVAQTITNCRYSGQVLRTDSLRFRCGVVHENYCKTGYRFPVRHFNKY